MVLLWILFVIYVSCLSCFLVCSLQPCGHLLGKGLPLVSLVCDVFLCFDTFPCCVLGQVWYLIVSIPDLCPLTYFDYNYVFASPNKSELPLCVFLLTNGPRREKLCLRGFANNTGADQPAHPRSLISAFVIRFLENVIYKLGTDEISIF